MANPGHLRIRLDWEYIAWAIMRLSLTEIAGGDLDAWEAATAAREALEAVQQLVPEEGEEGDGT